MTSRSRVVRVSYRSSSTPPVLCLCRYTSTIFFGERRTQIAPASHDFTYCQDQFIGTRAFEHVACGTVSQRLEHIRLITVHGQDNDPGFGGALHHLTQSSEAVDAWHHEIEQEHIRPHPVGQLHHFRRVSSFANENEIRLLFQQDPQALADEVMVISQKNTDAHTFICFDCLTGSSSGSSAVTLVPRPGADSTVKSPPSPRARSSIPVNPKVVLGLKLTSNPIPLSSICTQSVPSTAHTRTIAPVTFA